MEFVTELSKSVKIGGIACMSQEKLAHGRSKVPAWHISEQASSPSSVLKPASSQLGKMEAQVSQKPLEWKSKLQKESSGSPGIKAGSAGFESPHPKYFGVYSAGPAKSLQDLSNLHKKDYNLMD